MRMHGRIGRLERDASHRGCRACAGSGVVVAMPPPVARLADIDRGEGDRPDDRCRACGRTVVVRLRPPDGPRSGMDTE